MNTDYLEIRRYKVAEGDTFSEQDIRTAAKVCLIGQTVADELFTDGNSPVGTHVTIQMEGEDETEEYDIVGRTEADPLNGKISDESPVGHALLEKAVGDTAEVLLPTGHTVNYKVLGITHSAN